MKGKPRMQNVEKLKELAKQEPAATLLKYFAAKERARGSTDVSRLLRNLRQENVAADRESVLKFFACLADLGYGSYDPKQKRFNWQGSYIDIAQMALHGKVETLRPETRQHMATVPGKLVVRLSNGATIEMPDDKEHFERLVQSLSR